MLPGLSTPSGAYVFITAPAGHADDWRNDFAPASTAPEAPDEQHWLGIDHIGISVDPDQLDAEVSFYRTLFGLYPGPVSEFMDPQGRLQSRVLRPAQGELRVVLSVAEVSRSVATHTGVNQLAFACADLLAIVPKLRHRGVELLQIPDNYYDDLQARFELDPDFVRCLRDNGVLYDRDEGGEFLHVYTQTVAGRFYVELLQRIGNYAGYGAPNTHVRLAAQVVARRRND